MMNFLIGGRSLLLYQFTKKAIKVTVIIIMWYHCYQLHAEFCPVFSQIKIR
jgi:hypothetical protein